MTCLVAGDSIALALSAHIPGCLVDAKVGLPSGDIVARVKAADVVVLSAGSNDPHNPRLVDNLKAMRAKARGRVIWIVPTNHTAAAAVNRVAMQFRDKAIPFVPGSDRVHPISYQTLAASVRSYMKN
jgi:hypothetical protein